jgi:uncharacterized protein
MSVQQDFGRFSSMADIFKSEPDVVAAWLFGSVAKGRANPLSDIDFAVLLRNGAPTGLDRLTLLDRLARALAKALGRSEHDVDVEPLNDQGIVFQYNVIRSGKLIYECERKKCQLFVWGVVMRYLDFRPTLEIFDRASGRKLPPPAEASEEIAGVSLPRR